MSPIIASDPEYQPVFRNNIILSEAAPSSKNSDRRTKRDIGDVRVWCVEDPIERVALGAVALAGDMPDEMYTSID